jgi:hypothetical protein
MHLAHKQRLSLAGHPGLVDAKHHPVARQRDPLVFVDHHSGCLAPAGLGEGAAELDAALVRVGGVRGRPHADHGHHHELFAGSNRESGAVAGLAGADGDGGPLCLAAVRIVQVRGVENLCVQVVHFALAAQAAAAGEDAAIWQQHGRAVVRTGDLVLGVQQRPLLCRRVPDLCTAQHALDKACIGHSMQHSAYLDAA